jgi:hypothetical protein
MSERITEVFAEPEIDQMQDIRLFTGAHEKIVGLQLQMDEEDE